jgi:hypothetical protein
MKEVVEKFVGRKSESSMEKGSQHHNLIGVKIEDSFILGWPPLDHGAVRKKVFPHKLENLLLIKEGGLELLWV